MKNILIILLCILVSFPSFSQNENPDASYLKIVKEYTLNNDGSIEYHYTKKLKLLTHFSFHRLYGETFIKYNTDFQKLKINSAFTIMADGKKIVTPDNAFNEVLPRFSNNAPSYNKIREMVVTHTALERNSIINLDYTITTKKGFYNELMGDELLEESSPVDELIIKVIVPDKKTLTYSLINKNVEPKISKGTNNTIYTWIFKSIPANSKDYYQISNHELSPRLVFSTAKDLKSSYDNFVNQDAFVYTTNESMNKTVTEITESNSDPLTTALEIQKLVVNDLNSLHIPLMYTGFKCRTAIETWNSNQGTNLEKAILLTSLLQKANIKAEPVTVIPEILYNTEIGNLLTFNSFLVKVKLKKHADIYLSANQIDNQNLIFSLEGNKILVLDRNIESLKTYSGKSSMNNIVMFGKFDFQNPEKGLGEITLELKAQSNPYFDLLADSSKITSMIRGDISRKDFVSTEIQKLNQEASTTKLEFEKEAPFEISRNYMFFKLPTVSNGVDSWHMNVLPSERTVPLEIPRTIHEKYEYQIVFTEDFKLVTNPTFTTVKNDAGQVTIIIETSGNEVTIKKEIVLNRKVIEAEIYADFREIMNIWNNDNYGKIVLKK